MPSEIGASWPWYFLFLVPNFPPPLGIEQIGRVHHHQVNAAGGDAVEADVAVLVPDGGLHHRQAPSMGMIRVLSLTRT